MINDIFSSSTASEATSSTAQRLITIDTREKNSLVPAELYAQNFKIEYKQLPIGDYIINGTIIERKEIKDFAHSIKNQRLWKQLSEIKQYQNYLLIIEGNIYTQKNLSTNAIKGAILSAATKYKVPILFTQHPKETAQYITILANKKEKTIPITPIKTAYSTYSKKFNLLQTIPEIGPVAAKKLLNEYSTLKNIFNSTEEKLKKTIGKKATQIIKIIN